jgi:hypothetical protein
VLLRSSATSPLTPADSLAETARDADRGVVPASEQAVWSYDASASADRRLAPVYADGPEAALDYPYLVLARDAAVRATAARLQRLLTSPAGTALLSSVGFRTPDGAVPDALTGALGQHPAAQVGAKPVPVSSIAAAVRTASLLRLGSRMLAVVDIGRDFGQAIPEAGFRSGLDLAKEAAAAGLNLLPDDSEVGVWAYARGLHGRQDHLQVVPIAPLDQLTTRGTQRQAVAAALAMLQPVDTGGAGLYDTVLAAVQSVQATWKPGMVNSVVLLGDGRDDDPGGIGLGDLVARLVRLQDPRRPVPVISVLLGPGGDDQAMRAIAAVTGGATYRASDPSQLAAVFLDAIGQRACRPTC